MTTCFLVEAMPTLFTIFMQLRVTHYPPSSTTKNYNTHKSLHRTYLPIVALALNDSCGIYEVYSYASRIGFPESSIGDT